MEISTRFFSAEHSDRLWDPPSFLCIGKQGWSGWSVWITLSSAELKRVWSCTCTPTSALVAWSLAQGRISLHHYHYWYCYLRLEWMGRGWRDLGKGHGNVTWWRHVLRCATGTCLSVVGAAEWRHHTWWRREEIRRSVRDLALSVAGHKACDLTIRSTLLPSLGHCISHMSIRN